jgi:hypothetical protein
MLKNILILLILSCTLSLAGQQAQQRREAFEQVEAEKIAFFTRYMELTTAEARDFWPVYDELQNHKNQLLRERQMLSRHFARNHEKLPERELIDIADRYVELQVKEAGLTSEYHNKLKTILPPEKIMRFYQAENEFRMQLLRRVRAGGQGRGYGRQGR